MSSVQRVLTEVLSYQDPLLSSVSIYPDQFTASELAEAYVHTAFLITSLQFLKDEHWLQAHRDHSQKKSFAEFLSPFFSKELKSLDFLQQTLTEQKFSGFKNLVKVASWFEVRCLEMIKARDFIKQKEFSAKALSLMSQLFQLESRLQSEKKLQGLHLGLSLYRTFDRMDDLFNLNYAADIGMKTDLENTERLYEGAGVGVQSGYSTVLTALEKVQPSPGSRFIDLGSGYGRVGLVVGLLRPDLDFIGYEFVPHRVDIANVSTENLGLQDHVHFYVQDLSVLDFQIPEAEIYYLYDPFSEETYGHVLNQLVQISRTRAITIVTKGNARGWLQQVAQREGWSEPEQFDSGNLCLFRST